MKQTAVFGGGCFWCTEAVFQRLKGILSAEPGYSGGHVENPTYEEVSSGTTGHVEATKIEFDDKQIGFGDLLNVFFATHDPTALNRQGADVGPQYRSVIFYMDDGQKEQTEDYIRQLMADGVFDRPIVTAVERFYNFYPAEDYHKNYYNKNSGKPYCQLVINPKLEKLKTKFQHLLQ